MHLIHIFSASINCSASRAWLAFPQISHKSKDHGSYSEHLCFGAKSLRINQLLKINRAIGT